MVGKTSHEVATEEVVVKPHSCTSVLSLFHQFSMLGAARGFTHSLELPSIDCGDDSMEGER